MAVMYVTEYAYLAKDGDGNVVPAGMEPSITVQKVTYTGTAAASSAFNQRTKFVRVWCDTDAHIAFGVAPTAVNQQDEFVTATYREIFGVRGGDKVSAIVAS